MACKIHSDNQRIWINDYGIIISIAVLTHSETEVNIINIINSKLILNIILEHPSFRASLASIDNCINFKHSRQGRKAKSKESAVTLLNEHAAHANLIRLRTLKSCFFFYYLQISIYKNLFKLFRRNCETEVIFSFAHSHPTSFIVATKI